MSIGGNTVITLPRAAVWACAIFLAVAFVFAGFLKLQGPSAMRWGERFAHLGLPCKRSLCRRSVGNPRWPRCVDSQVETSRCGNPGRSHDWRAGHARRSRRIPAPHSAACPWRARVSVVLGAPSAGSRIDGGQGKFYTDRMATIGWPDAARRAGTRLARTATRMAIAAPTP